MTVRSIMLLFLILITSACSNTKDYLVTISTPHGDMKVILYEETPLHKENFLKLARSGQFDSTIFHRVMQNFMIQGGDVNAIKGKDSVKYTLPAEIVEGFIHHKGALAAARMPDEVNPKKLSSGCQFYIVQGVVHTEADLTIDQYKLNMAMRDLLELPEYAELKQQIIDLQQVGDMGSVNALALLYNDTIKLKLNVDTERKISPKQLEAYTTVGGARHLDGEYTVFGRVVEGLEVVDAIAAQPTAAGYKPFQNIPMIVKLEKVEKTFIKENYGYQYPQQK